MNKHFRETLIAIVLSLVYANCSDAADSPKYHWLEYHDHVYMDSKNVKTAQKFEQMLLKIINQADQKGRKTPPGILAEYGYVCLERGEVESAISFFQREAKMWPESKRLMERMISTARQAGPANAKH